MHSRCATVTNERNANAGFTNLTLFTLIGVCVCGRFIRSLIVQRTTFLTIYAARIVRTIAFNHIFTIEIFRFVCMATAIQARTDLDKTQ